MRSTSSRWSLALLSSLLLLATIGFSSDAAPEVTSSEGSGNITRLMLRDYAIAISAGHGGVTRYDIYSPSGQILAADLTTEQLQAGYPTVYNSLRPAVADSSTGPMMLLMELPEGY